MDYLITINELNQLQMTFDAVTDIRNNVFLSYKVKRGSFFLDRNFGSRLHTIKTISDSDVALAKSYGEECTKWMIDIGRIKNNNVAANRIESGINITNELIMLSGIIVPYIYFHRIF